MFQGRNFLAKALIAFMFIYSSLSFAGDFVAGEGRFLAKEDDSLTFIKEQLLASAFKDVITKEIQGMGLSPEKFWKRFEERFDQYFSPVQESLQQKYNIKENPSNNEKQLYAKALRYKRLRLKAKFGRLDRAIQSYVIKKRSVGTQFSNSRYLSLMAKVDRRMLNNIYTKFTRMGHGKHFRHLYLTTNFELKGASWSDLGVIAEKDFTQVVNEHWKQWLQNKLKGQVDEVVLTDEAMHEKLSSFNQMSEDSSKSIVLSADGKEVSPALMVETDFNNSIWMRVNVIIEKISEDEILKKRKFEVDGDYITIDLREGKLIQFHDFIREDHTYPTNDDHQLSSQLASLVYKLPLVKLKALPEKISSLSPHAGTFQIEVNNLTTIDDLFKIIEILSSKGVTQRFYPTIYSYSGARGKINLSFTGETQKALSLIKGLNGKTIRDSKKISVKENEPLILNIDTVLQEGSDEASDEVTQG